MTTAMCSPVNVISLSEGPLSQELFGELWEELFLKTGALWGRISSGSMGPLLRANDRVLVERINPSVVRFGDVILFKSGSAHVVHRVLARRSMQGSVSFLEKGDRNPFAGFVPASEVLGRVRAVERNTGTTDLVSGRGRVLQIVLACYGLATLVVRQMVRGLLRRFGVSQGRGLGRQFDRLTGAVLDVLVGIAGGS